MKEKTPLLADEKLWAMIQSEFVRQCDNIELVASENYASKEVILAQGSVLTNKYAEGYPGRRYYGGCEYVDQVESLAIERAKALFNADYANVQPHSGSQANAAVMHALLKPNDVILGMALNDGGHLTHGSSVNFSGRSYHAFSYGVNDQGVIDYDQVESLAKQHQPKLIIAGFSAYTGTIDWKRFREIADQVGAYLLADMAHVAGLIAAKLYPSPLPYAHVVTTTTHKTLRGPRGGMILSANQPDLYKKLDFSVFPVTQGGPLMHVIAAKAVAFAEALQPDFKSYQQQVMSNAQAMASHFSDLGISVLSGGTCNHMLLINLVPFDIDGLTIQNALDSAGITLNRNSIPQDPRPPMQTSGLRIGTPAMTTRGLKEDDFKEIAEWVKQVIRHHDDEALIQSIREKSRLLCERFPIYTELSHFGLMES
ncbi:MAG TPA: serine hydroxymethyltransferase [Gammaproteobacteria bacterium]|nr:serine hydroxymethyltransferase [Gammaproteobacteria bacterium]